MTLRQHSKARAAVTMAIASLFAFAALSLILSAPVSEADGKDDTYYFGGSIMDSLSYSNGVDDKNLISSWSMESARGYAVAGDYAYVSFTDGTLKKIELRTGNEIKSVDTGVKSGNDYLAVGDGLVLDPRSGNVYDLDLNQKYKIEEVSSQAYCSGGCWYIVTTGKECYCYATQDQDPSVPDNVQTERWSSDFIFYIDGFTLPVSLAFNDRYIFYPGIGSTDNTKRILYCVDKGTGIMTDSFEMIEIKGTYWNSGFVYCQGNNVAVSTHWDTMYKPPELGDNYLTMFRIDVDSDGHFVNSSAAYITNGYNDSYCSCLVMSGDLGFAQTGLSFKVFDLKTNKILASTEVDSRLGKTYSNIAVAVGNDGHVHGYVAAAGLPNPLKPVDGLICFDYNKETNEIRTFDLPVGKAAADNTNSIVIGSNGEVLFAKNDGVLHCLVGPLTPEPPTPEPSTDGNKTFKITIGIIGLAVCAFVLLIVAGRRFR